MNQAMIRLSALWRQWPTSRILVLEELEHGPSRLQMSDSGSAAGHARDITQTHFWGTLDDSDDLEAHHISVKGD